MTSRKFWIEFAKIAKRFTVTMDGHVRTKDRQSCPVCEVANALGSVPPDDLQFTSTYWRCNHYDAAKSIGLDLQFAIDVAHAADWELSNALATPASKRIRKKLFKIMGRTRGL